MLISAYIYFIDIYICNTDICKVTVYFDEKSKFLKKLVIKCINVFLQVIYKKIKSIESYKKKI